MERRTYRLGSRGSRLALWQAHHIRERLLEKGPFRDLDIVCVRTRGDIDHVTPVARLGGKGVFVKEIEERLLDGDIDIAVHSMKDMPAHLASPFRIAACVGGAHRNDCFLFKDNVSLDKVPPGSRIGTGSPRRRMQLLLLRPDLRVMGIRGNVSTRIAKMDNGEVDGLILARAGLERLGLEDRITQDFGLDQMVPAAGQGIIAIEARQEDAHICEALRSINDDELEALAEVEFSFVRELGGGCNEPVGVLARRTGDVIKIWYFIGKESPSRYLRGVFEGMWGERLSLGKGLAEKIRGAWRERFGEGFMVGR